MALAIFDLDDTLLSADSDHAWGEFVSDRGLVDADAHRQQNAAFFEDYRRGELDIEAYMRFSCTVLALHDMPTLHALREEFLAERIMPLVLPKARALVEKHRSQGDELMVVTATIEFITAPIANIFGIDNLIAPTPEIRDGRYTGDVVGTISFREGKVTRIMEWIKQTGHSLAGSYCYSDSRNDVPMLELADYPTVVDPDPALRKIAQEREWPAISLRD